MAPTTGPRMRPGPPRISDGVGEEGEDGDEGVGVDRLGSMARSIPANAPMTPPITRLWIL